MNTFWQKIKDTIWTFWRHQDVPPRPVSVDMEYKEYVCTIQPRSSFLTPLQADTLWAALMWTHCYLHGDERKTRDLVHAYPPQILVSDGFPYGYLPKPKNFIPIEQVGTIVQSVYGDDWDKKLMGIEIAKRLAEQELLPVELVNQLVAGEREEVILERLLRVELCPKRFIVTRNQLLGASDYQETLDLINTYCNVERCDAVTSWEDAQHKRESHRNCARILKSEFLKHFTLKKSSRVRKNRIDRVLMRAMEENGLFSQEEEYLLHDFWWVFVRVHPDFGEDIRELFGKLADYGYGRRKSVGKGQFDALIVEPKNISGVQMPKEYENPDGFMTLSSSYVPYHQSEFTQSRYITHIKRGKVDGYLATTRQFLKKPIVMYEAGSVFKTEKFQPYYGNKIDYIYPKKIVQYGYAFPLKGKFFTEEKE
ncbi:hypothetical protein FJZ31_33105 [Candidatus Poribacteria bacterium]|nr:hypothetical protein [Candidatus Poribacteria bacterium]